MALACPADGVSWCESDVPASNVTPRSRSICEAVPEVPSGHDYGAIRRGHRGGRFRGDRRSHPAQADGLRQLRHPRPRNDLGGTWHVNHYPGLAVDVPTTTYSYFFEPNPNWSRLFSTGTEIKQYADDVADKYDVRRHMRFNTAVEGARWDEDAKMWRVALAGGETLTTRYLITATGFLSQPKMPDIPGITGFAGKVIHTAAWDDDYDLENRRVAIIGTGATAVQLIPELAKKAADLTVYQRTAIWVVPKIDMRFSERAKRLFARVPLTQRAIRWRDGQHLRVHHLRGRASPLPAAAEHRRLRPGQDAPVRDDPRQRAAQEADTGLRLRLQAAHILQRLLPHLHQTARAPADQRNRAHRAGRDCQRRRHQDRHRHPDTGHRFRPVGGQLPRHRGHRARRPQSWKVVARHPVPGLPGRVDAVLPQLPQPGQPVRVPRAELLQHDGIPDAAHGPAASPRSIAAVPPRSRSPRKPTPATWTG